MNGVSIGQQESMIYLGLPLGSNSFISDFFDKNMSKSERAFYSLYGLGCRPYALNPRVIAFIYKQFAQSIFRHGLDMLEISCKQLNMLEIRQNKLIKNAIGIGKFCKTTPLNKCLKLDSIDTIYLKHKMYFLNQIRCNTLTSSIHSYLTSFYNNFKKSMPMHSFCNQLNIVNKRLRTDDCSSNTVNSVELINNLNIFNNNGLYDTINFIIDFCMLNRQYNLMIVNLKQFLNYEHYNT